MVESGKIIESVTGLEKETDMGYQDLRGWLEEVKRMGELKTITGAHWDKEIGGISELIAEGSNQALLFDEIPGYPKGFRVLSNAFLTGRRTGPVLGVDAELPPLEMLNAWRKRLKEVEPVPPVEVKTGPVKQNIISSRDIDLYKFPTPIWHELDGGRFLGTGCAVITKDPDEGWVNLGTYRCQIFDKDLLGVGINPGKHATTMMEKYHRRGESVPVAVVCGMDPTLFLAACSPLTGWRESEYDFAGWVKGQPIEVVRGETTGLPIPATAEIVVEGEIPPPDKMKNREDGPFGEWRRTYSSAPHSVMVVKSISYRDDPIILGVPPLKPHIPFPFAIPVMAAEIWNVLEYAGIPEVKGVWFGLGLVWPVFLVIQIKQSYAGHAKQAALAAAACRANTVGGLFVIVVDEDIDITNEKDVIWAISSRAVLDNAQMIKNLQTKAGGPPRVEINPGGRMMMLNDRVIIDACWPYERRDHFPVISRFSPGYQAELMKKWKAVL
jgi:UbiD family decarboxylase